MDSLARVAYDQSNSDFAIDSYNPQVALIAPNGGERLSGLGQVFNVRWTASDTVGLPSAPITLRFSSDEGATWSQIAASQPNTPPYAWTIPAVDSTQCRVSVEAEDWVGHKGYAQSAANFSVDSLRPFVVSVSPTDGATSVSLTTEVVLVFSEEMSREAAEAAFSLSASPPVPGSFGWDAGGTNMTFTPSAALNYGTVYQVAEGISACDLVGNEMAAALAASFTTLARGDIVPPHILIQCLDKNDEATTLKDGDYISKWPRFKGIITDDQGIDQSSIKFYLDGSELSARISRIDDARFEVFYTVVEELADESVKKHTVKVTARDLSANLGERELKDLKVSSVAKIQGPVLLYPTVFKPSSGTPAKIAYHLCTDTDVIIYIFDTSGQNVWTRRFNYYTAGGKAGYNEVLFDGISDLARMPLGNGIYVLKIVVANKIIGTGYITIFE